VKCALVWIAGTWGASAVYGRKPHLPRAGVPQDQSAKGSEGLWLRAVSYGRPFRARTRQRPRRSQTLSVLNMHWWPGLVAQIVARGAAAG
jgi:hypothetical protein